MIQPVGQGIGFIDIAGQEEAQNGMAAGIQRLVAARHPFEHHAHIAARFGFAHQIFARGEGCKAGGQLGEAGLGFFAKMFEQFQLLDQDR